MNKKANRRAFFVCMFICLMYVSLTVNLPEKITFKRVSNNQKIVPANMNISMQKNTPQAIAQSISPPTPASLPINETKPPSTHKKDTKVSLNDTQIEPSLFMSIPIVCFAIKERLLEKEGLIPGGKTGHSAVSWKKPIDILYDRDEAGLKNITKAIGIKRTLDFLKQEGITLKDGLTAEEIVLGRGYFLERKKLLSLYNKTVSDDYSRLFPFALDGTGIARCGNGFEFVKVKDESRSQHAKEDEEWQMPNLLNLPIRTALERLAGYTTRIKIQGSGIVTEQYPKPFDRARGETECIIYGRARQQ